MKAHIYYNSQNTFGEKVTAEVGDVNPEDHKEMAFLAAMAPIFERHAQELRKEIGEVRKALGYEEEK